MITVISIRIEILLTISSDDEEKNLTSDDFFMYSFIDSIHRRIHYLQKQKIL